MFDYYKFRFGSVRGAYSPHGYDLQLPVGLLGAVGLVLLLYLLVPHFGVLMWRDPMPPAGVAFLGCSFVLFVLAHVADVYPGIGLWAISATSIAVVVAAIPGVYWIRETFGEHLYYPPWTPPSAFTIALVFVSYGLVIAILSLLALRHYLSSNKSLERTRDG
jgi:hypothetical protein